MKLRTATLTFIVGLALVIALNPASIFAQNQKATAKVQQVKQAEGQAAVRVLQAKGEADAMQYLLPLKQKQIEQSKLEAEARKETTVKGAEAAGEALGAGRAMP